MGVFPSDDKGTEVEQSLPHARGGVSDPASGMLDRAWSSPRPWGCFPRFGTMARPDMVFPTPVGVFRLLTGGWYEQKSLPHARGGVSPDMLHADRGFLSSPRPWGCFSRGRTDGFYLGVFPTPVGVFLTLPLVFMAQQSLPHARGGVSLLLQRAGRGAGSSPRPWGCFRAERGWHYDHPVFPTPVGVFLHLQNVQMHQKGLPHARGGVSQDHLVPLPRQASSPRPWGCFLFLRRHVMHS